MFHVQSCIAPSPTPSRVSLRSCCLPAGELSQPALRDAHRRSQQHHAAIPAPLLLCLPQKQDKNHTHTWCRQAARREGLCRSAGCTLEPVWSLSLCPCCSGFQLLICACQQDDAFLNVRLCVISDTHAHFPPELCMLQAVDLGPLGGLEIKERPFNFCC